jgi:AcrR family transcriptional regulator
MSTVPCSEHQKLDPRVRRTRKLLEDAFKSLLSEKPYDEISVADITDRATVNRATFYAHFEDKQHLATTMLKEDLHCALLSRIAPEAQLERVSLTDVGEALFEFLAQVLGRCPKHADKFAHTLSSTLQQAIYDVMCHWLERSPKSLKQFSGASRETASTVIAWGFYGAAVRWSGSAKRPPARVAVEEIVAMLLREA